MPAATRHDIAERLRDIHLARIRLAPLVLAELLVRVPEEAVRSCGMDRALLMLVRDDELVPASVSDAEHAERAADYLRAARAMRPGLADAPIEAEAVATRRAVLVADAAREARAFRPLVALADTHAYVVAPLVHPDRTLALLFADRRDGPPLDELDRELVWTFAAAVAPLVHLATLAAIARTDGAPPPSDAEPAAAPALTPREIDVLRLMAQGSSNAAIAERLVVSETTVKTHVRQILRKLGAANRTEAVSRYTGNLRPPAHGA